MFGGSARGTKRRSGGPWRRSTVLPPRVPVESEHVRDRPRPDGREPGNVEERLLRDHLVHTRAGSYLSKKHGTSSCVSPSPSRSGLASASPRRSRWSWRSSRNGRDSIIPDHVLAGRDMRFLQELAGRVEEAAQAGGKFAEALVRTAGVAVSGALAFVDRRSGLPSRRGKKRRGGTKGAARKTDTASCPPECGRETYLASRHRNRHRPLGRINWESPSI